MGEVCFETNENYFVYYDEHEMNDDNSEHLFFKFESRKDNTIKNVCLKTGQMIEDGKTTFLDKHQMQKFLLNNRDFFNSAYDNLGLTELHKWIDIKQLEKGGADENF